MSSSTTTLLERVQLVALDEHAAPIATTEASADGKHRSWIMLFPEGQFEHPQYGKLNFTHARLSEIKRDFDARVRKIDIALDANHDQDKATGWLEQLQFREAQEDAPAGLWGLVRWTPLGMQYLKDEIYKYFSPEFGPWTDPETGERHANVLIGGGLTNRPFLKRMPAVQLSGDGDGGSGGDDEGMTNAEHTDEAVQDTPATEGDVDEQYVFADDPEDAVDGGADEGEELDDGGDESENDDAGVDASSDTHAALATDGHSHGKFGRHSHDGDASHADAPLKGGKGSKKMSDGGESVLLAELTRLQEEKTRLQGELQEKTRKLYEREIGETVTKLAETLGEKRTVSRAFRAQFEEFMLNEGYELPTELRGKLVKLFETALTRGLVRTDALGSAGTPDLPQTENPEQMSLALAENLAQSMYQTPLRLLKGERHAIVLAEAARQAGYRGAFE